jgi:hypothetical protein
MKIAIYGCSYADENSARYPSLNPEGKSWATYLRDNNLDVTNFSRSGSSVYWSYKTYQENYKNFDKNIFLATFPNRITIADPDNKDGVWFVTPWGNVTDELREIYKKKQVDKAVELYYGYIHNPEEAQDYKDIIMDKLKQDKNTLVVDVADLFEISTKDYHFYERAEFCDPRIYIDNRYNHMNNLNNTILSNKVNEWLSTSEFNLDKNEFQNPRPEDVNKYFIKIT